MMNRMRLIFVIGLVSMVLLHGSATSSTTSDTRNSQPPPTMSTFGISSKLTTSVDPLQTGGLAKTTTTESPQPTTMSSSGVSSTTMRWTIGRMTSMGQVVRMMATLPTTTTPTPRTTEFIMAQHRIPTQLEEKLETLSCDLPLLPTESRLWKGNETHELLLPFTIVDDCPNADHKNCLPPLLSWKGDIDMQSGDVLLVRIDDSRLLRQTNQSSDTKSMIEPTTNVYQVTRTGHDNCDVTEGVLLDITPLKIDNRKVVTLYDKDLTEGINLLIVVSELWGSECVRLKVIVKSDNCGENEDCSGKGLCYSNVSMEGYECQCCPGFVGPHCEEQDACYPSPCKNNGICVDITQGHDGSTFQCLCPYGYTGRTCEEETDPCTSMPCQNGGNCTGNVTQFKCECPKGFSGVHCQHNLNECESSPCLHGICVYQEDGYRCFCQPGFTGTQCEYEYNECESSPCVNGGTCTDRIGDFTCSCGRGFTGKRCDIKIDLCEPNPCFEPRSCIDHGNNYTCDCPKGFTASDCLLPLITACGTNPCSNGGTCWSSVDSFYCACKPGYTGKTCEDAFVNEKISNQNAYDADGNEMDLEMPLVIHLDHLHNVYIAVGTLFSAFLFVAIIVTVCHCRVNQTYKRFAMRPIPLWGSCHGSNTAPEVLANARNSEWFSGKDKASMATPSRNLPSLDTTDMYYTLDFSDSQSSPLIQ